MRAHARAIRAGGGLGPAEGFRTYEPGDRVNARLEVSSGRWLRGREAGVDVMGDGALVPYAGGIRKRLLEPAAGQDAFDAVRAALS